jgi:soluble lytic murein transglycosylase-like protein
MAGASYLRTCFDRYASQPESTFLALGAYNIGPGPVEKLTRSDAAERFVKKVLSVYNRFTDSPIPVRQKGSKMAEAKKGSARFGKQQ